MTTQEITIFKPEDSRAIGALLKGSLFPISKFMVIANKVWQEKFRDCDPRSFIDAVQSIASLGLSPDQLTGQAYLIPFGKKVQLMVGYKGFITLMRRAKCKAVNCDVVYEGDKFFYELGSDQHISHTKKLSRDRGAPIATWASCKIDGETIITVLTEQDIDRIKASSQTAKNPGSVWQKHEDEMRKKSALRRLAKLVPYTEDGDALARAAGVEDETIPEKDVTPVSGITRTEQVRNLMASDIPSLSEVLAKIEAARTIEELTEVQAIAPKLSESDRAEAKKVYTKRYKELDK